MNNEGKRVERQESAGLPLKKEKMTLKRFWKEWREVILILAAVRLCCAARIIADLCRRRRAP